MPDFGAETLKLMDTFADFNAGIGIAEMLGRANYIALVGGGKQPKFPQNKVGKQKLDRLLKTNVGLKLIPAPLGHYMGRCKAEGRHLP